MKKEQFDELIKNQIKDKHKFGYSVLPNKDNDYKNHVYDLYFENEEFNNFCLEMKQCYPKIYKSYARGKGSELVGNPPKMASVGSSSRFCYLALRNASISDFDPNESSDGKFEFEKDLEVNDIKGTNPQMDAFIETKNSVYFFEFKCHELFDSHKKHMSEQYNSYLKKWGSELENKINIPFHAFGLGKNTLIDLKQFITHLTGIANYESHNKKKVFSYVYFRPANYCESKDKFETLKNDFEKLLKSKIILDICAIMNLEIRLYIYENVEMNGFEKSVKPLAPIASK